MSLNSYGAWYVLLSDHMKCIPVCCPQLSVVIERIQTFTLASPLAKFLNGLEILLSKAQVSSCAMHDSIGSFNLCVDTANQLQNKSVTLIDAINSRSKCDSCTF